MNTLLISYDLIKEENSEGYTILINHIKSYGTWAKPLESFWLIKTSKSATEVRNELQKIVDQNDKILVVNITGSIWASYNLAENVANWIKSNI